MTEIMRCLFVNETEAARAMSQLGAAGIQDEEMDLILPDRDTDSRADEVGVPDSAASFSGLRGGEGGEKGEVARVCLTVRLDQARVGREQVVAIIRAAGGTIDD
ncbi:hypothetical protein [Sphingosinicella terrae]|uniref:hypothetical protein n=1 Tax=Sphingosinicella terrae TaxID=2172047 RepID=UPI000E0D79B2|nr:hypothetical protein [Sphingosinicella terrae]